MILLAGKLFLDDLDLTLCGVGADGLQLILGGDGLLNRDNVHTDAGAAGWSAPKSTDAVFTLLYNISCSLPSQLRQNKIRVFNNLSDGVFYNTAEKIFAHIG